MALDYPTFSLQYLQENLPKQSFRLGKTLVSCGDVANIKQFEGIGCFVGSVHSEKSAAKWYTKVQVDTNTFSDSKCVCYAHTNPRKCKHIAAVLIALVALRDYSDAADFPEPFQRVGLKKFNTASPGLKEKISFDLTWPNIITQLGLPPPKKRSYATSNDKMISTPQSKGRKKRKITGKLEDMTCVELKEELKKLNLPTSGLKAVLVQRLRDARQEELLDASYESESEAEEINEGITAQPAQPAQRIQLVPRVVPSVQQSFISQPSYNYVYNPDAYSYPHNYVYPPLYPTMYFGR
jgi:hypothetical protein